MPKSSSAASSLVPSLKLVSFKLCPFVQRSVILLNEKGIDFDLRYIDLANKPDWFHQISPLGKVPVLSVDDGAAETTIFESAVIAEYLDETHPPSLHPKAALDRALHRAWIEFSSNLLMAQYRMLTADNPDEMEKERLFIVEGLQRLNEQRNNIGPYFSGSALCLLDTAVAPLFMRLDIVASKTDLAFYPNESSQQWASALAAKNSVQQSVVDDFESLFLQYFEKQGGYLSLALMS